jgi:hypothetical protein
LEPKSIFSSIYTYKKSAKVKENGRKVHIFISAGGTMMFLLRFFHDGSVLDEPPETAIISTSPFVVVERGQVISAKLS